MNPSTTEFEITPEMVDDAEREKDRLEGVINDAQRKHGLIMNFLRVAAAYKIEPQPEKVGSPAEVQPPEPVEDIDPSNLMGALARIANESAKPLAKKELKAALIASGVDEARVSGPYFYVAIDRLKKKERLSVLDDGRVWKALPNN